MEVEELSSIQEACGTVGEALCTLSSPVLSLISWGLSSIREGTRNEQGSLADRAISLFSGALAWTVATPFLWLLPVHSIGHRLKWAGSREVSFRAAAETSVGETGRLKIFSLNAALGNGVMEAFNFSGTPVGLGKLRERSERIVEVIEREGVDLVALQEVFSPDEGEFLAQRLSELGYDVVYNAGSAMHGWVGYNSGLISAVKRTDQFQMKGAEFRSFRGRHSVDWFAAKGALMVEIVDSAGQTALFTNTHLQSDGPRQLRVRDRQVDQLKEWAKESEREILIGDMNCFLNSVDGGFAQGDAWIRGGRLANYQERYVSNAPEGIPYWGAAVCGSGVKANHLGDRNFVEFVRSWRPNGESGVDGVRASFLKRHRITSPCNDWKELLRGRDREEWISEYALLRYPFGGEWKELLAEAESLSDEELLARMARGLDELFGKGDLPSSRLEEVHRVSALRTELIEKVVNRKRMDRMFTRGFADASYRVADEYFDLSDHRALLGHVVFG